MSYTQDNIVRPGQPPLLWSDIDSAFKVINQNFVELYATIGGGSIVDFSNLSTDVSPSITEIYDLGSPTKKWKDLYLSGNSLYLGDAVITTTGTSITLPIGSTIAGSSINNEYFKTITVDGQTDIVADAGGDDTLTFVAGNSGITLTTDANTDTLTITNSGVINAVAGTGISVSATTGSVTFTNAGVTGLTAGQGVSLNASIGNITVTNSGLIGINPGFGITVGARNPVTGSVTVTNSGLIGINPGLGIIVSDRDPVTGLVTVTNSQPNVVQNLFRTIAVPTQTNIVAESFDDTLTVQTSGNGISITTNSATGTITFALDSALSVKIIPRSVNASETFGLLIPNGDITDIFVAQGLTGDITIGTPSGIPVNGQRLLIRLRDNGAARLITWTTTPGAFRAIDVVLPATTTAGKLTYVGCIYNSADSFWDVIAAVTEA